MDLLKKQAHNANKSLIIGLKCVDGIIIGSDRRINLYWNNKFIGSREATKVFKGNNFIVGFYNSFSYLRKDNTIVNLGEIVKLILKQAPNYKVFLDLFSNQPDNYIYEFLLGYFDSCEYQLEHYVLNRKKLRKKLIRDYFINSIDCGTNFLTIEKELKKDRAKEIVKRIIGTTTFIQDELMYIPNVVNGIDIVEL